MYTPKDDYGEELIDDSTENVFENEKSAMDTLADKGHVLLLKQAMLGVKEEHKPLTIDEKKCDWMEALI